MKKKICISCGLSFKPHPQVPQQTFCSSASCQKERKRQWQSNKLKTDPDYRNNQSRAQLDWSQRNPDYSRKYRETHPEYVKRNRDRQRVIAAQNKKTHIAKMDESIQDNPLPSGIYRMNLVANDNVAKMDVWIVEIKVHTCDCLPRIKIVKR